MEAETQESCNIVILTDSREQTPLEFPPDPAVSEVRRETLPYGDYMVAFNDGTRPPVTWERKSLPDLYGTLTKGYPRFKAELLGVKEAGLTLILLIEGSLTKVGRGIKHSQESGTSMLQRLFTLQVRYRLPIIFAQDAEEAARYVLEQAKAIGREWVLAKTRVRALEGGELGRGEP